MSAHCNLQKNIKEKLDDLADLAVSLLQLPSSHENNFKII